MAEFETFFLVCTDFSPVEKGGGWMGERGGGSDFYTATFRAGEATKVASFCFSFGANLVGFCRDSHI